MHHAKAHCCNTNTNPQYADNDLHIGDFAYPYFLRLAGSEGGYSGGRSILGDTKEKIKRDIIDELRNED